MTKTDNRIDSCHENLSGSTEKEGYEAKMNESTDNKGKEPHFLSGIWKFLGVICALMIVVAGITHIVIKNDDSNGTTTLDIQGSTTVYPIVNLSARTFMEENSNVKITVRGTGSGNGIKAVGNGSADIGMASRDLKDEERASYPGLKGIVIARDIIAMIVHKANNVTYLTQDQVKAIYNGSVTNWKELGGPDLDIVIVGRDEASGTREFFGKHVLKGEPFADAMLERASNGEVHDTVQITEGAIGFVGLGFVDEEVKPLRIYHNGKDVVPSAINVKIGKYPIFRNLTFIIKGDSKGLAKNFIDFVLGEEGQAIVEAEGFVRI